MPRHAAGPALQIERLSVSFDTPRGEVQALREVSLEVEAGEVFGIAGESGSGKSTLAYAIMGDLAPNARVVGGTVRFAGDDLLRLAPGALRRIRGRRIAMVYQDPKSALNPTMRIGQQIAEVLEIHALASRPGAAARALELLALVNIPDPPAVARAYPHQLSGGMQQRVVIAMALAGDPALLIMDEPTTGLDVTTQARILDLVEDACTRAQPPMATVGPAHVARCLRWETAMAAPPVRQERRLGAASGEIAATVASVRSLTKHFDEPGALTRWLGLARPPVH